MTSLTDARNAFRALFSILNPITVVPLHAELTKDLERPARRRLFSTAILVGFVTLTVRTFPATFISAR